MEPASLPSLLPLLSPARALAASCPQHGRFKGTVEHTADAVVINGKQIKVFNKMNVSGASDSSGGTGLRCDGMVQF